MILAPTWRKASRSNRWPLVSPPQPRQTRPAIFPQKLWRCGVEVIGAWWAWALEFAELRVYESQ